MTLRITELTHPTLIEELGERVTGSINLENAYPAHWCEVEIRTRLTRKYRVLKEFAESHDLPYVEL